MEQDALAPCPVHARNGFCGELADMHDAGCEPRPGGCHADLRLVEIGVAEAHGAQHRARACLLQAVDHQAGVLPGICNFFCARVMQIAGAAQDYHPQRQLPVSTMRRSRSVMMMTPARVITPPTTSRLESTSPSSVTLKSTENTGERVVIGATLVTG